MNKHIVCFASGTGSNVKVIHEYFQTHHGHGISAVVSNKRLSPLLPWAESLGVQFVAINRHYDTIDGSKIWDHPIITKADIIVLAGFLLQIPTDFINQISVPIINIHPSLLPAYGGKGMYGKHVHQAVLDNHESQSGITIHHVNEKFDDGEILFQATCNLTKEESLESLSTKIQKLEHENYPRIIESLIYTSGDQPML